MSEAIQLYFGLGLLFAALIVRGAMSRATADTGGNQFVQVVYWLPFTPILFIAGQLIFRGLGLF